MEYLIKRSKKKRNSLLRMRKGEKKIYIKKSTEEDNVDKYIADGYTGNFLMSQENKKTLLEKEKNEIKEDKKEEEKTPWKKSIVAFKDFVFN